MIQLPKLLLVITLMFVADVLCAQKYLRSPENTTRFLADKVLSNSSRQLINVSTGELHSGSEKLPVSKDVKLKSKYVDWHYENGVLNLALQRAAKVFGDPKYSYFVRDNYIYAFQQLDYFKKLYDDPSIKKSDLHRFFKMDMLDNCGTMGAALIEVAEQYENSEFRAYLDKAADYISNKEYRLKDGTFVRDHPVKMTLWGDDLYMGCIFLARMGTYTGEQKYFDDAANQVIRFTHYLFDKEDELYNHAYIVATGDHTPAYWGRANGWIMMAQVELLAVLPPDHPKRNDLLDVLRQQIRGIVQYQGSSGRWHQVLNRVDSYEESSCTAMYTYSIAKAVNEGWVSPLYARVALMGWEGLKEKITEDAQVLDICVGTHVELNAPFYFNRPRSVNDTHGLASTILAGTEIHRMVQKTNE